MSRKQWNVRLLISASAGWKRRDLKVGVQLPSSLFRPTTPVEWCHPQLEWVFPPWLTQSGGILIDTPGVCFHGDSKFRKVDSEGYRSNQSPEPWDCFRCRVWTFCTLCSSGGNLRTVSTPGSKGSMKGLQLRRAVFVGKPRLAREQEKSSPRARLCATGRSFVSCFGILS